MGIKIIAFGQITDIIGKSELKITDVSNTEELRNKLAELFPALNSIKYSIAVNKKVLQTDKELRNKDEVALLPPFSGG